MASVGTVLCAFLVMTRLLIIYNIIIVSPKLLLFTGPEKELLQLAVFAELHALFPGVHVHIELVGPSVPQNRSVMHFLMDVL
jgi:hypothetical protein